MPRFLCLLPFAFFALPASALDMQRVASSYLVPYVGDFDILDKHDHAQFGLEYRWHDIYYGLRPTIGVNIDNDGDKYGYAGGSWDIALPYNFFFTPNFMVGAYTSGGTNAKGSAGKSLGGGIEFRSGLELSYAFDDATRLGVAFNHISNASIYSRNPGAESLLVNYHLPLGW